MSGAILKYLKHFCAVVIVCLIISFSNYIRYGVQQLSGQIALVSNTIDIHEALQSDALSTKEKQKLQLIEKIKKFAADSLGLVVQDNYSRFYQQHDLPVLWILTASPPFELKSYEWKFPVIGYVSYKGFFKKHNAIPEYNSLKKSGFDVDLSPVSAWSTLGLFSDPVLSDFLKKSDGKLAELILHELTHATIFNKNSNTYNENLATFIGQEGAKLFLKRTFNDSSQQVADYLNAIIFDKQKDAFFKSGAAQLDSLYKTFTTEMTLSYKIKMKQDMMDNLIRKLEEIIHINNRNKVINRQLMLNNTDFVMHETYNTLQDSFYKDLSNLDNNLTLFIAVEKKKAMQ